MISGSCCLGLVPWGAMSSCRGRGRLPGLFSGSATSIRLTERFWPTGRIAGGKGCYRQESPRCQRRRFFGDMPRCSADASSSFSFLIPFWALSLGFLRVACYPPAASQIATAKTSVNAGRHRRTYRQEPGHKGGVGGAPKEARRRRREDAPGGRRTCVPAELRGVVLSAFEHRLDRTARTYRSFIGAPESDRLP